MALSPQTLLRPGCKGRLRTEFVPSLGTGRQQCAEESLAVFPKLAGGFAIVAIHRDEDSTGAQLNAEGVSGVG